MQLRILNSERQGRSRDPNESNHLVSGTKQDQNNQDAQLIWNVHQHSARTALSLKLLVSPGYRPSNQETIQSRLFLSPLNDNQVEYSECWKYNIVHHALFLSFVQVVMTNSTVRFIRLENECSCLPLESF